MVEGSSELKCIFARSTTFLSETSFFAPIFYLLLLSYGRENPLPIMIEDGDHSLPHAGHSGWTHLVGTA